MPTSGAAAGQTGPLARALTEPVAFLASGNARWMTGAIVPVDAGATAITAIAGGAGSAMV